MKLLIRIVVVLALLAALAAAVYSPTVGWWKKRNQPDWRTAEVVRGNIVAVVNSTGSVKPVQSVSVGAFVSGPISEVFAVFNQEVMKGTPLAKIDPQIYLANVNQNRATLATRRADVKRAQALLNQAINNEKRAVALRKEDESFVAEQEMDALKFTRESLKAQVELAEASVEQAQATLENSEVQLGYTNIDSPVAGIVIHRKVDPGQTLASQFQTPEMFIIAPDMREKMHVHASVDEADIGLIKDAQLRGRAVVFTVDAYPDDLFRGTIEEIRLNSTTTQNVVTYPVIVAAPNPDLKLLPGMTASISFRVDERNDVVKIPNSALRFFPDPKHVREPDRKLLDGSGVSLIHDDSRSANEVETVLSAEERSELRRKRHRRHVWVVDSDYLRAVEVITGICDSRFTELVSGEIRDGDRLVTGLQPKKPFGT